MDGAPNTGRYGVILPAEMHAGLPCRFCTHINRLGARCVSCGMGRDVPTRMNRHTAPTVPPLVPYHRRRCCFRCCPCVLHTPQDNPLPESNTTTSSPILAGFGRPARAASFAEDQSIQVGGWGEGGRQEGGEGRHYNAHTSGHLVLCLLGCNVCPGRLLRAGLSVFLDFAVVDFLAAFCPSCMCVRMSPPLSAPLRLLSVPLCAVCCLPACCLCVVLCPHSVRVGGPALLV